MSNRFHDRVTAPGSGDSPPPPPAPVGVALLVNQDANRVPRTIHLASAALPAASAYTNQAAFALPDHTRYVMFYVTYTRGAAGGFARFRLMIGNGTEEGREFVIDPTVTVVQPDGTTNGYLGQINGPAPADGTPIVFDVLADKFGGATTVRLLAAEFGVPGTPGTCAISLTAGSA